MFADKTINADQTEKIIEKYRFWQIIFGGIVGFATAFLPLTVNYINNKINNPSILCDGHISITYPKNKEIIYDDEIDVAGIVKPTGKCKHIFLVVAALNGHNYFVTDCVTVNPDGTWDATAKLQIVPPGTKARIQARLCGKANDYPPEGCLAGVPNKGVASNSIVIVKQPKQTKFYNKSNILEIKVFKFYPVAMGQVVGVNNVKDYKIVIYTQDTKFGWVKQPFPSDKQGYGWASLDTNGYWCIQMRQRASQKLFTKKRIIILMKKSEKAPDRVKYIYIV